MICVDLFLDVAWKKKIIMLLLCWFFANQGLFINLSLWVILHLNFLQQQQEEEVVVVVVCK